MSNPNRHNDTFASAETVRSEELSARIEGGKVVIKGKCGKAYAITREGWKDLKKKVKRAIREEEDKRWLKS